MTNSSSWPEFTERYERYRAMPVWGTMLHEIISWGVAVVSTTLFIVERRKNDNTKYYMALQGLLRACHQRAGFLANALARVRQSGRVVPREEVELVVESEYVNYLQLQEQIMGSMKSLEPEKDMPFDVGGFVNSRHAQRDEAG